jgi:hypothetical protein
MLLGIHVKYIIIHEGLIWAVSPGVTLVQTRHMSIAFRVICVVGPDFWMLDSSSADEDIVFLQMFNKPKQVGHKV